MPTARRDSLDPSVGLAVPGARRLRRHGKSICGGYPERISGAGVKFRPAGNKFPGSEGGCRRSKQAAYEEKSLTSFPFPAKIVVGIRSAILKGDVDRALKLTDTFYPNVLKNNPLLYFRLRRRKLVEMIRNVAETAGDNNDGYPRNGYNGNPIHDFGHDMDIDDSMNGTGDWDGMDVEEEEEEVGRLKVRNALDAAVEYGQRLRIEFSSDTRPEIKKPLEEAFSLLAYTDPKSSVLAHLLDEDGRIADGEELNSAILGKGHSLSSSHIFVLIADDVLQYPWAKVQRPHWNGWSSRPASSSKTSAKMGAPVRL